ncbi:MAG: hypothetical protein ABIR52_15425 [Casimicrobiaceae bacterium]
MLHLVDRFLALVFAEPSKTPVIELTAINQYFVHAKMFDTVVDVPQAFLWRDPWRIRITQAHQCFRGFESVRTLSL